MNCVNENHPNIIFSLSIKIYFKLFQFKIVLIPTGNSSGHSNLMSPLSVGVTSPTECYQNNFNCCHPQKIIKMRLLWGRVSDEYFYDIPLQFQRRDIVTRMCEEEIDYVDIMSLVLHKIDSFHLLCKENVKIGQIIMFIEMYCKRK